MMERLATRTIRTHALARHNIQPPDLVPLVGLHVFASGSDMALRAQHIGCTTSKGCALPTLSVQATCAASIDPPPAAGMTRNISPAGRTKTEAALAMDGNRCGLLRRRRRDRCRPARVCRAGTARTVRKQDRHAYHQRPAEDAPLRIPRASSPSDMRHWPAGHSHFAETGTALPGARRFSAEGDKAERIGIHL